MRHSYFPMPIFGQSLGPNEQLGIVHAVSGGLLLPPSQQWSTLSHTAEFDPGQSFRHMRGRCDLERSHTHSDWRWDVVDGDQHDHHFSDMLRDHHEVSTAEPVPIAACAAGRPVRVFSFRTRPRAHSNLYLSSSQVPYLESTFDIISHHDIHTRLQSGLKGQEFVFCV